jgi:hypothetical protein
MHRVFCEGDRREVSALAIDVVVRALLALSDVPDQDGAKPVQSVASGERPTDERILRPAILLAAFVAVANT